MAEAIKIVYVIIFFSLFLVAKGKIYKSMFKCSDVSDCPNDEKYTYGGDIVLFRYEDLYFYSFIYNTFICDIVLFPETYIFTRILIRGLFLYSFNRDIYFYSY
ncbi:unnamed protein product [Trifolium pratense]|uniref:Uncharacterized protein n=1 Tax=Trifolium pratense TaxID=57577 RepID=A0ACB0KM32_TRIPR|nr:unnamed protein product [Trifolium pratense]